MTLLSFSETNTSLEPASAHFLAQSALSMSLAPHFSSLTQPLILVALGALSLARDAVVTNVSANKTNSNFFIGIYLLGGFCCSGKLRCRRLAFRLPLLSAAA